MSARSAPDANERNATAAKPDAAGGSGSNKTPAKDARAVDRDDKYAAVDTGRVLTCVTIREDARFMFCVNEARRQAKLLSPSRHAQALLRGISSDSPSSERFA